ncbi:MAG: HDOD domain-containing protein [Pseudomonadales bacterium]
MSIPAHSVGTPDAQALRGSRLRQLLQAHPAFSSWHRDQFEALSGHSRLIQAQPGQSLLNAGDLAPHIHFLLAGSVELEDSDHNSHRIEAGSSDAHYPIARIRPALFTVKCLEPTTVLLVEQSVLRKLTSNTAKSSRAPRFDLFAPSSSGSWHEHPLVAALHQATEKGTLRLPVIPGVALKIRRALTNENYQLSDITKIVSADPVISARLLQLANSPVFRGASACDSLQSAVLRLGIHRVQNLVLALASAGLFKSDNPLIKQHLLRTWRHLMETGALTAALARLQGSLDPDLALLTGLLHEIGKIPILERAVEYPDLLAQPGLLEDILAGVSPMISAATLREWQLPEDLVMATERQHEWSYDHGGDTNHVDLLLVAHIYAARDAEGQQVLPRLDETPAFARITGTRLSAKQSLQVINEAAEKTRALKALLS